MNPNKNNRSITRLLTVPNTSRPADSPENEDVNERIADLERTIKKLQLELIDLTSKQESSKESSKMSVRPRSKIDTTMHFDHVNLISDHEMDTTDNMDFSHIDLNNDSEDVTDDTTNVRKLSNRQYHNHSEEELNNMISNLKTELHAKLKDLKHVVYDEDNEELVRNLSFNK